MARVGSELHFSGRTHLVSLVVHGDTGHWLQSQGISGLLTLTWLEKKKHKANSKRLLMSSCWSEKLWGAIVRLPPSPSCSCQLQEWDSENATPSAREAAGLQGTCCSSSACQGEARVPAIWHNDGGWVWASPPLSPWRGTHTGRSKVCAESGATVRLSYHPVMMEASPSPVDSGKLSHYSPVLLLLQNT